MKQTILNLKKTNKGHNMFCDIKDAYVEVLKYHIRRNEGTEFKFRTSSCAEADAELIKAIAKVIAKVENISCRLASLTAGIADIEFGVSNIEDGVDGFCARSTISCANRIRIKSEFKRSKFVYETLLHEIVHFAQSKMMDYEFDSQEVEYKNRKQEIQAYTISELIISML